jgi:threonine dehydrogenase-like Zn-dependent dehydrogenase
VNDAHALEIVPLPDPAPREGELVVRVDACGICGSDLETYDRVLGETVLGHEACGEIVAVGDGVCLVPDALLPAVALMKEAEIRFAVHYERREFVTAARLLESGGVAPRSFVSSEVPLGDIGDAFEHLLTTSTERSARHADCMIGPPARRIWTWLSSTRRIDTWLSSTSRLGWAT